MKGAVELRQSGVRRFIKTETEDNVFDPGGGSQISACQKFCADQRMIIAIHHVGTDNDDAIVLPHRELLGKGTDEVRLSKDIDGNKASLQSRVAKIRSVDEDVYLDIGIARTGILHGRRDHRVIAGGTEQGDGITSHDQKPVQPISDIDRLDTVLQLLQIIEELLDRIIQIAPLVILHQLPTQWCREYFFTSLRIFFPFENRFCS